MVEQDERGCIMEEPKSFLFLPSGPGHITEDCRTLKDHLGQLEKAGYHEEFIARDNLRP